MKILVANRGEIARRVFRTARRLGHETVAVYADPDASAPFVDDATVAVNIGPAELSLSYLAIDRILDAAVSSQATAVHPGYGFLSENAVFARAVVEAGLVWIGPNADAIEQMGSKIRARGLAAESGVPIIPGYDQTQAEADLAEAAARIGFPVLVKAAAGGGGKGIRIVAAASEFAAALAEATAEAQRSFGDGAMIVERYIQRPRHVEVQVVGDAHGHVIHLGTRECSVQRRYQKLLEEAPAPNLPDVTRHGLQTSAVTLAAAIGYDSAGTVEFIVDDTSGEYFFLEMNTRLQVEHPVTEAVTGLDLVELQIRSATGQPLPFEQDEIVLSGHAFEARVNAEDPGSSFAPQIGTISHLTVPDDIRWDSGVVVGSHVSSHYDSMVAKLVVSATDRPSALARLALALDELVIGGLTTNTGFHRWLVDQPPLVEGRITTRFLDETDLPDPPPLDQAAATAAAVWVGCRRTTASSRPWASLPDFSLTPHRPQRTVLLAHSTGAVFEIAARSGLPHPVASVADRSVAVNVAGVTHTFRVLDRTEGWAPAPDVGHGAADSVVSPFPAVVTETPVVPGDHVSGGDVVVVIEAMKMLHALRAAGSGIVAEVRVAPGDQTETHQVLITFEQDHR